ncbi:MAG: glutathione S-transferase family protein [Alphaproteobacteria bacterium]|nr:glutathione S-transferase family protein [Alphaproteobacteria bacterium]
MNDHLDFYMINESLYCAKTRILLRHKGLTWSEHPPPGGYGSNEYKKVVPSGNLPCLFTENFILSDSEAIAEYIEEKFSRPPMLPNTPEDRAICRCQSRFHDTRLEPALRALFNFFPPKQYSKEEIYPFITTLKERLEQFDQFIRSEQRTFSSTLTLADCGYAITFTWIELLLPRMNILIELPETTQLYKTHIEEFKAVKSELDSYKPCLKLFLDDLFKTE